MACFVCYFKIVNTVLKSDIYILKQIVWETKKTKKKQKRIQNVGRPHGSCIINQNVPNIVLINNSRTTWPTKILMPFSSFTDYLLQDAYIVFQSCVNKFWKSIRNMLNFGLGCSSPLNRSFSGKYAKQRVYGWVVCCLKLFVPCFGLISRPQFNGIVKYTNVE